MRIRIRFLKTVYPHWGDHAGFQQFVRHLNPEKYSTQIHRVPDGDSDLPLPTAGLRRRLRHRVQRSGMEWYKLSDLSAELRALPGCLLRSTHIVHYLDGEHGAQYLPAWLKKSRISGTKTIATYHQPVQMLDSLINPSIVASLDHVNLVSPEQREYFQQFLPAERISVVLHGVDTEFFRPTDRKSGSRVFRCVTVGHWLRDWEAIRAVATRLHGESDIEFHVVTNQPTGMEQFDNVMIHRNLSDSGLLSVYQQSDVLFLPLTGSTANNTLLEGIACGLPVVSTKLDSVAAYLPQEEGNLIENNLPDRLADAVLYLKRNPDARERMARGARQRAVELSWQNVAPQYERLYSRLVRG